MGRTGSSCGRFNPRPRARANRQFNQSRAHRQRFNPRPRARANLFFNFPVAPLECFNPRPRARANGPRARDAGGQRVSIRALVRGRTRTCTAQGRGTHVSIRALVRGRTQLVPRAPPSAPFQSAPSCEGEPWRMLFLHQAAKFQSAPSCEGEPWKGAHQRLGLA